MADMAVVPLRNYREFPEANAAGKIFKADNWTSVCGIQRLACDID
jgi:hypothetical protein